MNYLLKVNRLAASIVHGLNETGFVQAVRDGNLAVWMKNPSIGNVK
jgi:hypothetical protein